MSYSVCKIFNKFLIINRIKRYGASKWRNSVDGGGVEIRAEEVLIRIGKSRYAIMINY